MNKIKKLINNFKEMETSIKISAIMLVLVLLLGTIQIFRFNNDKAKDLSSNDINADTVINNNEIGKTTTTSNIDKLADTPKENQDTSVSTTIINKPQNQNLPLLIEFEGNVCKGCLEMHNTLEQIKIEYEGILNVKFVNIKDKEQIEKYNICTYPTQIWFDAQGNEIGRNVGSAPKTLVIKKLEEFGVKK